MDDHLFEHDNDRVVTAPTEGSSLSFAPTYPTHLSDCSLQLPHTSPNLVVMQTPAGAQREPVWGVHLPPPPTSSLQPQPASLSPSVADVLHLLDDGLSGTRQKFTHLSCSHGRGGLVWPRQAAQGGPPPMCHCWPPSTSNSPSCSFLHYNLSPHLRPATPLLS